MIVIFQIFKSYISYFDNYYLSIIIVLIQLFIVYQKFKTKSIFNLN